MPFLTRRSVEAVPLPYDPRSPEGLAARWVQWVAAAGLDESPIDDKTGAKGGANQPSDVWFLAGAFGGQVQRRCVVPAGRDLFVPVFNFWWKAGKEMDQPVDRAYGSVAVDGVPLEPDVITTPEPFTVAGSRFNDITLRSKPVLMHTWGLWKLLPAPAPGEHEVHIVSGNGYGFTLDVRYHLLVTTPASVPWG